MAGRVDPNTGKVLQPGTRRVTPTAEYSGAVVERKNRASEKPKDFESPAPLPAPGTPEFTAWASQPQKDTSGQVSGLSSYNSKPREASSGATAGKIDLDEHTSATAREVKASTAAKADIASDPDFAPTATEKATKAGPTTSNGGEHSEYAGLGKLLGNHFAGGYRHPGDPEASRNLMSDAVPAMSSKPSKEEKTANASALAARNASLPVNSSKVNKPYADHFNEQVAAHDAAQAPAAEETPASAAKPAAPQRTVDPASSKGKTIGEAIHKGLKTGKLKVTPDGNGGYSAVNSEAVAAHQASVAAAPKAAAEPIKFSSYDDVASKNNMGAPRTQDNGASAVSGRTSTDSQSERDNARKAARTGAKGGGKAAEASAASKPVNRRSAASAAPVGTSTTGPQFTRVGDSGAESSSASGRDWITPSQISGARPAAPAAKTPVANPDPQAPAPASNATPAAPSAPTAQPSKMQVIGSKPAKGVTPAHMASSASGRDWLTPQRANKAKEKMAAGKAPREAVEEAPTVASKPATPAAPVAAPTAAPKASAPAAKAPAKRSAASTAPIPSGPLGPGPGLTGSTASNVGRSVGNVNRTPYGDHQDYSGARSSIAQQRTPMASPQVSRAEAPAAMPASSRPTPSRPAPSVRAGGSDVVTPTGPSGGGRSGSAPRGEVGGGRMSHFGGGEHSVNVGGDNSGHITINHNTNNVNYGSNSGSIGNVDHGASRGNARPSGGGGGGQPEPQDHSGGGHGFNAWYKDSSGHHDLRKGIDHVTGKTGGSGEKLAAPSTSAGGKQKPLKGSARAAGGQQAQTQQNPTGTGSTNNWQGPAHQSPTSASGNGTAQKISIP